MIHQGLVACQYVDDTTVPCPSGGAVEAVMSLRHESAAKRYATKYGATFQQGANKSNVMSLGHSPPLLEREIGCSIVEKRNLLGFYMDKDLTFQPLLAETLAKSWKNFQALLHGAEQAGFTPAMLNAQILSRLLPDRYQGPLVIAEGHVKQ